jgi:hypothetical protein
VLHLLQNNIVGVRKFQSGLASRTRYHANAAG